MVTAVNFMGWTHDSVTEIFKHRLKNKSLKNWLNFQPQMTPDNYLNWVYRTSVFDVINIVLFY